MCCGSVYFGRQVPRLGGRLMPPFSFFYREDPGAVLVRNVGTYLPKITLRFLY
jgi:hypothetical protein